MKKINHTLSNKAHKTHVANREIEQGKQPIVEDKDLDYQKEHREAIDKFIVGAKDDIGNIITKIYYSSEEYIIYGVEDKLSKFSIRIFIHSKEKNDKTLINRFNKILEKYTEVRSVIYKVKNDRALIRARIALTAAWALDGKEDEANKNFTKS